MKKHHPVLHFLFAILAFGLLTGCETTADVTTQDSGESAKTVLVSTFAGGENYFADGIGSAARFNSPSDITIDAAGNLYVADTKNDRIRKITPTGEVSTLAGGEEGFADGIGSDAKFDSPSGIAIDAAGNLYVVDTGNDRIRKITPAGEVSTLAGSEEGFADGVGSDARFYGPASIASDAAGNLYVAGSGNNRIRKITPAGEVSTFAGGKEGFADGIGSTAKFSYPSGIASDAAGNLYVADIGNERIRKITPAGEVSTFAGFASGIGGDAMFWNPSGITIDAAGNLYVADTGNERIRKITPAGEVSTLAGGVEGYGDSPRDTPKLCDPPLDDNRGFAGGVEGFADGIGGGATFCGPSGITIDAAGNLYVADTLNHRIRKITPAGEVSTLAGSEGGFASPIGIASDAAGNLYVTSGSRIRKITPSGEVSTFAGGEEGFADGIGGDAKFDGPFGITIDAAGNLYVADSENDRILKITPAGEVSTLAGGEYGFADGVGSDAKFRGPSGIAIDAAGNLYVADRNNHRIRKITPAGEVSTLAGGEKGFADGIGSDARFDEPSGIAVDAAGNLYVADRGNARIRKIEIRHP